MAEEFDAAQRRDRKAVLRSQQVIQERIVEIYGKAAQELAASAARQKDGGLTERWQSDMAVSLSERMQQLRQELGTTIGVAAGEASQLPGNTAANWLARVLSNATGSKHGGDAFRSVLTRTSDEALAAVLQGRAYLDGKSLSSRIWSSTGRLEGGINEVISQGIAQKKSALQLARDLEAYVNPKALEPMEWNDVYPDIPFPLHVDYNAQRLARTSINHAYHIAMKEAAAANPFVEAIHWELSPEHYARQVKPHGADECDDYAEHNEGLGAGNWPVEAVPLPHAMCLCFQYAVVPESLEACTARLKGWLDGAADERLDHAFGAWKREMAGEAVDRGVRHDTAQRRAALIGQEAAKLGVDGMAVPEREKLFRELGNLSLTELERRAVVP